MTDVTQPTTTEAAPPPSADDALAAPPDERNPAIIDARKTFVITMVSAVLFVGAIIIFIL